MNIFEGKKLKTKEHIKDWDDSVAEVVQFGKTTKKWLIIVDGNFSCWYREEDIPKDFEEI